MVALKILFISLCSLVVGAAGVCAAASAPAPLGFVLLLGVVGWFYFFPICLLVALMWLLYLRRFAARLWRLLFVLVGAAGGGGLMALQDAILTDWGMSNGMVLGGVLAGGCANLLITVFKNHAAETRVPLNGDPAACSHAERR